jgi:hypothetical protein
MKSFFHCLILCGLVVLVGCSGDSPNQPPTTTVVATDVWQITSLVASNDNPIVNTPISVVATVTLNGEAAPDGTSVEFTSNGGAFNNGQTLATALTSGGQASVGFNASENGAYTIQARIRTITSQIQVVYRNPDNTGGLQMWSINPTSGSYAGGETVVLTGKGIESPVEVFFTVQGTQYQAIVDQVVPSVPIDAAGTVTIRTPEPTAADTTMTSPSDVRVAVRVGTTDEESQSYPSVFTFISDSVIIGEPVIFGVEPFYGRSSGGELVTILGLNFAVDEDGELVKTFDDVYFTFQGQELLAQVERWSATQIEVITPRFSLLPLTDNQNAGVRLTLTDGNSISKDDVFVVKSDIAEPAITGLSPTAGPLDGGTIVTISGHGFELPIQVLFGTHEATDVQVYDDQSLADNDIITCTTPDISQTGNIPPYAVNVTVTNLQSGNSAVSGQLFTFGDILYVGQANPTEGQIGDPLTLFGAGFEDPLTVWFQNNIEFDVLSVTGTELGLRSPTSLPPTCADRTGSFRVVLNQSNQEATGGTYTLLGSGPTITSVAPIFINEIGGGAGTDPSEIDIYGVRFADDVLVAINNFLIDTNNVTVVSSENIHVAGIPTPDDFGRDGFFSRNDCITSTGLAGTQEAPTTVDVRVENLPLGCQDTLTAALVYQPEFQTCVEVPPQIATNPANGESLSFPDTTVGNCSAALTVNIRNSGPNPMTVIDASLAAGTDFNIVNAPTNLVLDGGQTYDLLIEFCPATAVDLADVLSISHNAANEPSPILIDLEGLGL